MPERELALTRIAFLELKDEQRLVQEGFKLLDEKRILLATEIHRQLQHFRLLKSASQTAEEAARAAFAAALNCNGLDELAVYPPLPLDDEALSITRSNLLGLPLLEAQLGKKAARPEEPMQTRSATSPRDDASQPTAHDQPVNPTPEALRCALAYRRWLALGVELAACSLNLRRLTREYVRTERRARAIENILLPEIDTALKFMDEQLESMDQEEIARLRHRHSTRSP
jgi:V/A-type H+-transporting ATPase subunit D